MCCFSCCCFVMCSFFFQLYSSHNGATQQYLHNQNNTQTRFFICFHNLISIYYSNICSFIQTATTKTTTKNDNDYIYDKNLKKRNASFSHLGKSYYFRYYYCDYLYLFKCSPLSHLNVQHNATDTEKKSCEI